MDRDGIIRLGASVVLCLLAGAFGGFFTASEIPAWYASLNRPDFSPPNWVFGPAWTILYILMGVSLYLVWAAPKKRKGKKEDRRPAFAAFGIQLGLNAAWSFLFFGLHSPLYGLIDIVALWFAIAATIILFYRISRPAAMLLLPYIGWVTFASVLNYHVFLLN